MLTNRYFLIGAGVAGLAVAYMIVKGGKAAVEAINPMNHDNVINRGATGLYRAVTGSNGTIGGDIYDATHGGALDMWSDQNIIARAVDGSWAALLGNPNFSVGGTVYDTVNSKPVQAVNPANPDNLINRGVTSVGQSVTGDPNWTLGGAIYDWLH